MRYISAPQRSQSVLASPLGAAVSADVSGVIGRGFSGSGMGKLCHGLPTIAHNATFAETMSEGWIDEQLIARGIRDPRVLEAMRRVPREAFVAPASQALAYADRALPIGSGQTISQPFMVAVMTEALELTGAERVLEIGTGSGYQAAILAELASEVVTIERRPELADAASATLRALGYTNVEVIVGDGTRGHPPSAPFDRILVTAGAPRVPDSLKQQLATDGGLLVVPVGSADQQFVTIIRREGTQFEITRRDGCVFVPLVGAEGWPDGS
jgi:protein-L-isoaspartate(D-aspartate) O-methyltransferase